MAKKIKDYYDIDCAILLADKIRNMTGKIDADGFIQYISTHIEGQNFTARQETFATGLEDYITGNYAEKIDIFSQILGPELKQPEGMFTHGWWLWPIGKFVERNGTANHRLSLDFIYELTKRFTGEFAMRPLLEEAPRKTMEVLLDWSRDDNVHVRRLSSECVRIRLPWAKKSLVSIQEFKLYKMILGNLKNDPEKFVQKSVGNNLNDLMKDYPDLANEIINEWETNSPTKETIWIIKHGKRSLKKKPALDS